MRNGTRPAAACDKARMRQRCSKARGLPPACRGEVPANPGEPALKFLLRIRIIPIYTSALPLEPARTMYVCLCNRVTDRQLVEAAAELAFEPGAEGASAFAERVADRLGAGLGCGSCRSFAVDLVEQAVAKQTSVILPDREGDSFGLDFLPGRHGDPAFRRLPIDRKDGALVLPGAGGGRRA